MIAHWRQALLLLIIALSFAATMSAQHLAQELAYNRFADHRVFLGIPNFGDVTSNLAFLIVGFVGLKLCLTNRIDGARWSWIVFFVGVALVSLGSTYYHWTPRNETLFWDRLPMTIAFMGLFIGLLSEQVGSRIEKYCLLPAIILGLLSVIYWNHFGDPRPYYWVQIVPLLAIPSVLVLFRGYTGQMFLAIGLACYLLAKVAEFYDQEVFSLTWQLISGHSLKHLLAAGGCFAIYAMLKHRKRLDDLTRAARRSSGQLEAPGR